MGKVVQLSDYRQGVSSMLRADAEDSKVPVQFAVGNSDRKACLQILTRHGVSAVQVRRVHEQKNSALIMIGVKDAICLNKRILDRESLSDEEIAKHIDIIQMLENVDLATLERLWDSFTYRDKN